MNQEKRYRFVKASYALLLALTVWGIIGTIFQPINVTLYWSAGLGVATALVFITSLYVRQRGLMTAAKQLAAMFLIILGAVILNQYRGWPFGALTYHDILGWKILHGMAWPVPLFWTFILASALELTCPEKITHDTKVLFSWAFDAAIGVMLVDLMIEPILASTSAVTWSTSGAFLGIPSSSFVGWFLTAFVAGFAAILLAKPGEEAQRKSQTPLNTVLLGFSLLALAISTRVALLAVQILSLVSAAYFAYRIYKTRNQAKKIALEDKESAH